MGFEPKSISAQEQLYCTSMVPLYFRLKYNWIGQINSNLNWHPKIASLSNAILWFILYWQRIFLTAVLFSFVFFIGMSSRHDTTSPTDTACSSESPAFLTPQSNLLLYDQHSSEEELEVINGELNFCIDLEFGFVISVFFRSPKFSEYWSLFELRYE